MGIAGGDGFYTAGQLTWTGGANTGVAVEVKVHRAIGGIDEFDLWQRAPQPILVGDLVPAVSRGLRQDARHSAIQERAEPQFSAHARQRFHDPHAATVSRG